MFLSDRWALIYLSSLDGCYCGTIAMYSQPCVVEGCGVLCGGFGSMDRQIGLMIFVNIVLYFHV